MTPSIKITQVAQSRVHQVELNNSIVMGTQFTDHMFVCDYVNGAWSNARIEPLNLIPTHPAAMALHYGQAIFEGMKAYRFKDGNISIFRAQKHYQAFGGYRRSLSECNPNPL